MKVDLHGPTADLVEEMRVQAQLPDAETTILAGMRALQEAADAANRWAEALPEDRRRDLRSLLAESAANVAAGAVTAGDVAFAKARRVVGDRTKA